MSYSLIMIRGIKPEFRNKLLPTPDLVWNYRIRKCKKVYFTWINLPFSLQETNQRCYGKDGSSRSEIIWHRFTKKQHSPRTGLSPGRSREPGRHGETTCWATGIHQKLRYSGWAFSVQALSPGHGFNPLCNLFLTVLPEKKKKIKCLLTMLKLFLIVSKSNEDWRLHFTNVGPEAQQRSQGVYSGRFIRMAIVSWFFSVSGFTSWTSLGKRLSSS